MRPFLSSFSVASWAQPIIQGNLTLHIALDNSLPKLGHPAASDLTTQRQRLFMQCVLKAAFSSCELTEPSVVPHAPQLGMCPESPSQRFFLICITCI